MLPFAVISRKKLNSLYQADRTAQQLLQESQQAAELIELISQGKTEEAHQKITLLVEQHHTSPLAHALMKMSQEMRLIAEREQERQWVNEGLNKFVEILRIGTSNLELLYNSIISTLVRYVNANQGGLFVINEDEGEPFIELVACYAYDRHKFLQKRIEIGEGLLGQMYFEKQTIQYTGLPKNYSYISSGLGAESPSSLLIVPLKVSDKIVGMIELAAFHTFPPYQVEFIEKLSENIAPVISNAQVTRRTQRLLEFSQQQTEQLRTAEEEMRQNMEELQATQEEMRRKEAEINALLSAINFSLCMAEILPEGIIISVNPYFANLLGYSQEELKGAKLQHLLIEHPQAQSFTRMWDQVNDGLSQSGNLLFEAKNNRFLWLQVTFNPMKDNFGNIRKILLLGQDITANKEAEITFQRLSLVADNTDNAVIITDANGITEYVNAGFERMTGYKSHEIIGKKPGQVLQGPETDPQTVARISQKLKAKRPFKEEILNYTKDGKPYWISLTINPIFDDKGQLAKFISVQTEITQIKLHALDLKGKLDALNRSNAFIEFDPRGYIIGANENFLSLMGYTMEEILGKHHAIFVKPEERTSPAYKQFWENFALGKTEYYDDEFERITKSGRTVWLRGNYNLIRDTLGKPMKVIKIAHDITAEKTLMEEIQQQNEEIKTQQEELRQNLEELLSIQEALQDKQRETEAIAQKFNNILEGCADSVITIDKHGIISFFNATAEKLFGYDRSEVIGKNVSLLMPEPDASRHDLYIQRYEATRRPHVIGIGREVQALRKDGKTVPILLTLSQAQYKGESIYTAFIKDITRQKQLEQQTQEQLEQLRVQEEEIRQNLEELQASQEELRRTVTNLNGLIAAIDTTLATAEYDMEGFLITANDNFLEALNYRLEELAGKPHHILLDASEARSPEQVRFWENLRLGRPFTGEVKRLTKNGKEKWFNASYMPVIDSYGRPIKVIVLAQEITHQKQMELDTAGQLQAIYKAFAVAEFDMEGYLTEANENFLDLTGYGINEILGRHHKIFVAPQEVETPQYEAFWNALRSGKLQQGEFTMLNKEDEPLTVRGSYSPIYNLNGTPYKVVAYLQRVFVRQ